MSATCLECWSTAGPANGAVLDWVAPAAADAPLAASAVMEAAARAPGLPAGRSLERMSLLASPSPVRLRVVDGLAFNGYVGLQLEVARTWSSPPGLTGHMALVERIPAGRDGTGIERQLVRAVVGPLELGELASTRRIRHLAAVRIPEAAQPERLAAAAWIEDAEGRVVAFAQSPRIACR